MTTKFRKKRKSSTRPDQNLFRRIQVEIPVETIGAERLPEILGKLLAPLAQLNSIRRILEAVNDLASFAASPEALNRSSGAAGRLRDLLCKTGPDVATGRTNTSHVAIDSDAKANFRGDVITVPTLIRIQSQTWTSLNIFYAGKILVLDFDFGPWALSRHDVDEEDVEIVQQGLEVALELEHVAGAQHGELEVGRKLALLDVTTTFYPAEEDADVERTAVAV